jgi:hypothetical protein
MGMRCVHDGLVRGLVDNIPPKLSLMDDRRNEDGLTRERTMTLYSRPKH